MSCPQRSLADFKTTLSALVAEKHPEAHRELQHFFWFHKRSSCDTFALFGEDAVNVAGHVAQSLYRQPSKVVHVDVLEAIGASVKEGSRDAGKDVLKAAVEEAERRCGADALVVVHHAEALRGDQVVLFDAYLELFNGERGYIQLGPRVVSAFGARFLLLFESDDLAAPGERWGPALQRLWRHDSAQFTTDAAVGRIERGAVLNPCRPRGACAAVEWRHLFHDHGGGGGGGGVKGVLRSGLGGVLALLALLVVAVAVAAAALRGGRGGGGGGGGKGGDGGGAAAQRQTQARLRDRVVTGTDIRARAAASEARSRDDDTIGGAAEGSDAAASSEGSSGTDMVTVGDKLRKQSAAAAAARVSVGGVGSKRAVHTPTAASAVVQAEPDGGTPRRYDFRTKKK